jgi:hypothetical protein
LYKLLLVTKTLFDTYHLGKFRYVPEFSSTDLGVWASKGNAIVACQGISVASCSETFEADAAFLVDHMMESQQFMQNATQIEAIQKSFKIQVDASL